VSESRRRGGGAALTNLTDLRVAVVKKFDELDIKISYAILENVFQSHTSSSSVGILYIVLLVMQQLFCHPSIKSYR
jgi:hypothetical protein